MNIDLGRKSENYTSPATPSESKDTVHYPTLYIDGSDALKALPESGTMTVAFQRKSMTTTEREDETCCSVCLDITKILDIEPDASTGESKEDTVSILEKLADEDSSSEESE